MSQKALKKCVLSICDISPTKFGAFEEFIIALTERLKENDFEHVIIFRAKPIKYMEESLLSMNTKIEIIQPSKYNIYNFITFFKIIKRHQPVIVHFHFYPIYTIVNYLKYFFNLKIIYTDHMGNKETKTIFKKTARRSYYYVNSKLFGCGIDSVVCVSNFVKSKYFKEYGINSKKLRVIYNGINTDRFQKFDDIKKIKEKYNISDEFVITCVGLRKDKGAHCLVKAAPEIAQKIPRIKFFLVGDGECRSYLEELINEMDMRKHFIFTGNINYIEEIYNISSCVIIPSLVEEAFCFVAAESMSTETPVIAFDSGAIKEIIYNKSNVISRSSKNLSEKAIECLVDGDISAKKAREHVVKNFSLNENTYNYIKLYNQLLKKT